jgi:hypothetical protein
MVGREHGNNLSDDDLPSESDESDESDFDLGDNDEQF